MKRFKIMVMIIMFAVATLGTNAFCADKPLIIDVRTEPEWNEGHLEGAILIPYEKIGAGIATVAPDKKTKIHLYCRSGRRSGIALETLRKLGYVDVTNNGSVKEAAEVLKTPVVKGSP